MDTASIHINEIVNNLSKLGHNVVLMNSDISKKESRTKVNSKLSPLKQSKSSLLILHVIQPFIGEIRIFYGVLYEMYTLFLILNIISKQKEKFDIIYRRHSLLNTEFFLAKLFKISVVKEVNGIIVDEALANMWGDNFSIRIIRWIEKFNMNKADKIIAVTPRLMEVIHKDHNVPKEKLVVIENGANIELFKPANQKEAKEKLNLNKNNNYICYVGNLAPWQGVEYLIQSASAIINEIPNTRFLIVGDGLMKNELVELSKKIDVFDNFIFTGAVPHQEIPDYINASEVCVVYKKPLKSGYSPLKLYEYLACEKPVIASRLEGFEILEKNNAGILVEPENPEKLVRAVVELLKNEKLREEMGRNGRTYIIENHSWEGVAVKVAKVCRESLSR